MTQCIMRMASNSIYPYQIIYFNCTTWLAVLNESNVIVKSHVKLMQCIINVLIYINRIQSILIRYIMSRVIYVFVLFVAVAQACDLIGEYNIHAILFVYSNSLAGFTACWAEVPEVTCSQILRLTSVWVVAIKSIKIPCLKLLKFLCRVFITTSHLPLACFGTLGASLFMVQEP